ncbi:MAG TPA: hypothetical protein VGE47_12695, partial [Burkholderiaceae bacterium]
AIVMVLGSLLLAALEQQSLHAFTANSRATVLFADSHPDAQIYAATGGFRADTYAHLLRLANMKRAAVKGLAELDRRLLGAAASAGQRAFAIEDPSTAGWGSEASTEGWGARRAHACLQLVGALHPAPMGYGRFATDMLLALARHLPEAIAARMEAKLRATLLPAQARIYRVECPATALTAAGTP